MTRPVQIAIPLDGDAGPDRPQTSDDTDREHALTVSARYLDNIEARAHAPGVHKVDREDTLADVALRRARLARVARRRVKP